MKLKAVVLGKQGVRPSNLSAFLESDNFLDKVWERVLRKCLNTSEDAGPGEHYDQESDRGVPLNPKYRTKNFCEVRLTGCSIKGRSSTNFINALKELTKVFAEAIMECWEIGFGADEPMPDIQLMVSIMTDGPIHDIGLSLIENTIWVFKDGQPTYVIWGINNVGEKD